ncbi:hypothetical protein QQ008_07355 [Fulvivirgaceae bacterium BMA10]|uniref:Uncharacterized protein n=1 Tax=Splendidivirga corallicola TaxID=3051826 RepID=A0ABT8KKD1_9BACT|nr:hypothetical protein [Fulvivirgaceae bacterium BMA10]
MKKALNFLRVIPLCALFCACNQLNPLEEQPPEFTEEQIAFDATELNKLGKQFTQVLSATISDNNVKKFLKTEAVKQFDGDYDILFARVKDDPVQVEHANGRTETLSFTELLRSASSNSRTDEAAFEDLIEAIAVKYPLLQISLPELPAASAESWDTQNYDPLVVFVPADYEESEADKLEAFNTAGETIWLDPKVPPTQPTIVVGANERVVAMPIEEYNHLVNDGGRTEYCLNTPIMLNPYFAYFNTLDYRNIFACRLDTPGPIGGGGNGGSGSSNANDCSRETDPSEENVSQIQFASISKLRGLEDWVLGRMEITVWAIMWDLNMDEGVYETEQDEGKRKDYRTCKWFDCDPIIKTVNLGMNVTWDPGFHSNRMKYVWYEEDASFQNKTINEYYDTDIDITLRGKKVNERKTDFVPLRMSNLADRIGSHYVNFTDGPCHNGTSYLADDKMYFWVNRKNRL